MKIQTRSFSALVATASIIACGCTGISSYQDSIDGPRNGMTYYLPKTEFAVTFKVIRPKGDEPPEAPETPEEAPPADPKTPPKPKPGVLEEQRTRITMECEPEFVVDREAGVYTMHSSANEFFTRDHDIVIDKGLIKTVGLNDEGRIVQIVDKLGDVAVMAITGAPPPAAAAADSEEEEDEDKAGASSGPGGLEGMPDFPELEPVPSAGRRPLRPTSQELSEILMQLTPGEHSMRIKGARATYNMPGTGGQIRAVCSRGDLPAGRQAKGGLNQAIPNITPPRNCGIMPGIAARNSTRTGVQVSLQAEESMVASSRAATALRNVEKLQEHLRALRDLGERYDATEIDLDKIEKGIEGKTTSFRFPAATRLGPDAINEKRKALPLARKELSVRQAKTEFHRTEQQKLANAYQAIADRPMMMVLQEHTMSVVATIDERVVVIPLTRGPVGTTNHTLTLYDGVVGSWSFTKESAIEGLIGIPLEIAKDVVRIPAAAFETKNSEITAKSNLITAQNKLIQDQTTLINSKKALAEAQKPAEETKDPETGEPEAPADGE